MAPVRTSNVLGAPCLASETWVSRRGFFFIALAPLIFPPAQPQQTLYSQSLQTALTRQNPHLEFLLYDLRTQTPLANTFPNPAQPIPPGSLVKPFLALAYAAANSAFPTITCHGHSDQ